MSGPDGESAIGEYNLTGEYNGRPFFTGPDGAVLRFETVGGDEYDWGAAHSGRWYELYAQLSSSYAAGTGVVVDQYTSCRDDEALTGHWDDLGRAGRGTVPDDAADCYSRCSSTLGCWFALFRPSSRECVAYGSTCTLTSGNTGREHDQIWRARSNWTNAYTKGDGWFISRAGVYLHGLVTSVSISLLQAETVWTWREAAATGPVAARCIAPICYFTSRLELGAAVAAWDADHQVITDGGAARGHQILLRPTTLNMSSVLALHGYPSSWNVREVTNMSSLFRGILYFNEDISAWDVGAVTEMVSMFEDAKSFNHPDIGNWDVSRVTDMRNMFKGADKFNQPLVAWSAATGETAAGRRLSHSWQEDVRGWDVSKVGNLDGTFEGAIRYDLSLSSWDTSRVTSMRRTFFGAGLFGYMTTPPRGTSGVTDWAVGRVTDMEQMFDGALFFNGDVTGWDVSNVTTMRRMFARAGMFNRSLAAWDVSRVTTMEGMFEADFSFSNPLQRWNVSQVTDFSLMFAHVPTYDKPLHEWDTSAATNYTAMWLGNLRQSACHRHLIGKRWEANAAWAATEYSDWSTRYTCGSDCLDEPCLDDYIPRREPSPPPVPPAPPPSTPDWTATQHNAWVCGIYSWLDSARQRVHDPDVVRPHSNLDFDRRHWEQEHRYGGYDATPVGERNQPTAISGCCQCQCNAANTPNNHGRSCTLPNRPDGSDPSAGLIYNPPGTCRCPMCDECNNISWVRDEEYCAAMTLNAGRWVRWSEGESCDAPLGGGAGRRLRELYEPPRRPERSESGLGKDEL